MLQQGLQPPARTAPLRRQKKGACMQQVQVRQVQVKNKSGSHLLNLMQKLEPYHGSGKKVVVYNTYADKGRLHFDVFVPTDKSQAGQVSKDIDAKAVEYAKEFLNLIGKPSNDIAVN